MSVGQVEGSSVSFGAIVATIGSVLIVLGIAWLIALNWADIHSAFKILILTVSTVLAFTSGALLKIRNHEKISHSLFMLGASLYTLSIFLIAQIFNLSTSLQFNAFLLLLSWIGVIFASYIFNSSATLVLGLGEFLVWISLQYFSFVELFFERFSVGILAVIYLIVGIGFYGLTQIHKSRNHGFSQVYRFWTVLYFLLLTYILSFQSLLPLLWPSGFEIASNVLVFLIAMSVISVIMVIIGVSMSFVKNKITGKEIVGFVTLVFLYIFLIVLAKFVSGETIYGSQLSPGLWTMWIFDNILFVLVILSVIRYGINYKSAKIVNLAIMFFVLDIITRYIGFILDFGGQIGFAVMSIIGGLILVFGGWFIEKWRKKLISKTL